MKAVRTVSVALLALLSVYMIAFGLIYGTTDALLPHHAAAAPDHIERDVLPLYLAVMRLVGAAAVSLGVLCLFVVFGPVRNGSSMATLFVAGCLMAFFATAAWAATRLAAASGTQTHWYVMGGLFVLTFAALCGALWGNRKTN